MICCCSAEVCWNAAMMFLAPLSLLCASASCFLNEANSSPWSSPDICRFPRVRVSLPVKPASHLYEERLDFVLSVSDSYSQRSVSDVNVSLYCPGILVTRNLLQQWDPLKRAPASCRRAPL